MYDKTGDYQLSESHFIVICATKHLAHYSLRRIHFFHLILLSMFFFVSFLWQLPKLVQLPFWCKMMMCTVGNVYGKA